MKKVAITITNNISYDQRVIKIAQTLSKNFEVYVIGSNTRQPPPIEDLRDQYGNEVGFRPKRIKTFFHSSIFFYIEYNLKLFLTLWFMKIDLVYAVDLDTLLAGSFVTRISKKKLVFDSHEYFTELPELQGKKLKKSIWERVGYFGIRQSLLNITVNQSLAEILGSKYHANFQVVRNVPTLQTNQSAQRIKEMEFSTKPYFIYQGAVNVGRGIPELIEMMKAFEGYDLIIAGSGPKLLDFKKIAKNQNNIIFTGNLPFYELQLLTKEAMIGFNLLDSSSLNYYYSLANKFFDYTFAEIPSINMNFPEYRLLNNEFEVSVLIDNLNVENLISVVQNLVKDQSKLHILRTNCNKAKKEWNWKKEEALITQLFTKLPI